ncbi:hypothetical protein SFRURICE_003918, partial [Spodoptera frugiperda]
ILHHQRVIGDIFHLEQTTVHRIVHTVIAKITGMKSLFINKPRGSTSEIYRNRKGYFSLNVQMVCDANLTIRNIIAKWSGSVHDSTIFNDSTLCAQLERGDFGNMSILGDSGYPCRPYLLTPLLQTRTPAEEAYNRSQIATRNPIERLFGVLKRRFPCLQNGMGFKIDNIPPEVVACAVIHNIIQDVVICILRKDNYARPESMLYKSIRPGRKAGDPQVIDIRVIKYNTMTIEVKLESGGKASLIFILYAYHVLQEELYNNLHVSARNTAERTIGILKGRFRCL